MPARSPQPTPSREDEALARARTKRTPAFNTMASIRKTLLTASPAGTAATEAITPMTVSPEPPDNISFRSISSQADTAPDDVRQSPSFDDDGDDMRTPNDAEWRVRALFVGEKNASDQTHRRRQSCQESESSVPPLPPRAALRNSSSHNSESSVPSVSMRKSSRTRTSRSHRNSRSLEADDWSNDFGVSERRRSSSTNLAAVITPEVKSPLTDTTTASSSSECSPDVSPHRILNYPRKNSRSAASPVPEVDVSSLKALLTYRLGRLRTNKLMFILFLVAFMSLGFTVITNRAVIQVEEVIDNNELEEAMTRYERMNETSHQRSKHPPAGGLRGSLVNKASRNRNKNGHYSPDKKDDHVRDTPAKREAGKEEKKEEVSHKKEEIKAAEKKTSATSRVSTTAKTKASTKQDATANKQQLAIILPSKKMKIKQSFNSVDQKMFDPDAKSKTTSGRVVYLHDSIIEKSGPVSRHVQIYPPDFTDNTQLYGVLDSNDERLSKMELREPYSDEHCVPMQDWQTTFHPSCNGMHEMALDHMGTDVENDFHLFGTKGFWRNAWKVDILGDHHRSEDRETVVLKTLK